jgi:hypothetical protein
VSGFVAARWLQERLEVQVDDPLCDASARLHFNLLLDLPRQRWLAHDHVPHDGGLVITQLVALFVCYIVVARIDGRPGCSQP